MVQFYLGTDLQKALDDVRTRTDQARADLPRDVDPPLVRRLEIDDQPIITYAVSAPALSVQELSWFIEDTIARTLQAAPGVAQVRRVGGVDREINVVVDPERMAAQGLTADNVNQALAVASLDAPGGRVTVGGREQTLRILGAAVTVEQIRNITIPTGGGRSVRLSDVADVGDGSAEVRSFALLNGQPVVGFQVSKVKDASEITTENGVSAAIEQLLKKHEGVSITKILSRVDQTRAGFIATWHTLLEGMLLAALVVFIFLRDWRSTLITAIAMPVSLIPTFFFMSMLGFSLNMVTLLGLTLVIGILVDDAIVEIENIEKRVYRGLRPYDAAIQGADQIALAVVATTFAIAATFFPVVFMPGIPGQFFREFGVTVTVAVLFSLLVARLLTPLMAAYFLVPKPAKKRPELPVLYRRALTWALDHRWASVILATILFFLSIALVVPLPKGVQPEGNPNFLSVAIEAAPGSTISDMRAVVSQVHDLLAAQPEAESVFAQVGNGGTSGGPGGFTSSAGVTKGTVTLILKAHRDSRVSAIRDRIRPLLLKIPDARLTFDNAEFGSAGINVILTSETGEGLEAAGLALQRQMRDDTGHRRFAPHHAAERPRNRRAAQGR